MPPLRSTMGLLSVLSIAACTFGDTSPKPEVNDDTAPLPFDCVQADLGKSTGWAVVSGSVGQGGGAMAPGCMADTGADTSGQEVAFAWRAPSDGVFVFETRDSSYDTVLYLLDGGCRGAELGCNDDLGNLVASRVAVELQALQRVVVVVDAAPDAEGGDFELAIRKVMHCPDVDLGSATGSAIAWGYTLGGTAAMGTCADMDDAVHHLWTAPSAGTWSISSDGSYLDTALYVLDGGCGGPVLGCNDDHDETSTSQVQLELQAGQTVVIGVAEYLGSEGFSTYYQLNIEEVAGG